MRFTYLPAALAVLKAVNASPVPFIEWVTVTKFITESYGYEKYTEVFPQTSIETPSTTPSATTTPTSTIPATTPTTSSTPTTPTTTSTTPTTTSTTPTTTSTTPTTTSTAPTITTSSASSSPTPATFDIFNGQGTYYDTGLGACGIVNVDTDYIVALSHELFDQYTPGGNPNRNTLCGRKINAQYQGKSVQVTVTDRCEACKYYDLDFSPSAFLQLADQSLGRIDITWDWA
ncbi:hypothetical protein PUMCH_003969 [Australozyma saopauloensis]|uniref:RlpA-like protein double-psi beta-barrel domain-containing protein n=1 Tax=Australozyma saopauloensis TaxID=291208 RepID=A0AAX4HDZ1_9ASCO|nr:hypothetical protein PUMCH_003969 [[Candida] saopauloensis]